MPHAVYRVKGYVGQVQIRRDETRRDAVERRLQQHIADKSDLGKQIQADPEKALEQAKISFHHTKSAANKAERAAYDDTPASKRVNKQRPPA